MSTILFPTDFSGYSENAFQYILHFADRLRAKIVFQHVINVPDHKQKVKKRDADHAEEYQKALQLIHELKFRSAEFAFKNNCSIVTDHLITEGSPVEEILKAAYSIKPIVIAVSTHGYNTNTSMHAGSTTAAVLKRSRHPVLVIPEQAFYKKVKHIALAADLNDKDEALIYKLMITAALFDAKLHVFNVAAKKEKGVGQVVEYLKLVFKYPLQVDKLSFETLRTKAIAHGIDKYIKSNAVDLLCLDRHYQFFPELLDVKVSERKPFHTQIPTLVYFDE